MYHEPTSSSWLQAYRCLARQCPLASPLLLWGYCLPVSLGRRVLVGPPQRWLYHPRRSWLVPVRQLDSQSSPHGDDGPLFTKHVADWTRSVLQQSPSSNLDFTELHSWTATAVPYIPSMPAGSDTTCLQPGQHS